MTIRFHELSETELRAWADAHSYHLNNYLDTFGQTILYAAATWTRFSPAVLRWMVVEKDLDVNGKCSSGRAALHSAESLAKISILLNRGADPGAIDDCGSTPIMDQASLLYVECVSRLLEVGNVVETINLQHGRLDGDNALHRACKSETSKYSARSDSLKRAQIVDLLLQSGACPSIKNKEGKIATDLMLEKHPTEGATIALLDSYNKIYQLSKARRHIEDINFLNKVSTDAEKINQDVHAACSAAAPAHLQQRVAANGDLPQVLFISTSSTSSHPWRRRPGGVEEEEESLRRATMAHVLQRGGCRRVSSRSWC